MKVPLCIAFLLAALTVQAPGAFSQISARTAAPAPGPLMDQTIEFLQENLAKQSEVTAYFSSRDGKPTPYKYQAITVHLEEPCALIHEEQLQTVLHLDKTDPLSVSIKSTVDMTDQTVYEVNISKAVYDYRPFPVQTATPEVRVPPFEGDIYAASSPRGVVRSVNGRIIIYQPERGKFIQITTGPSDEVSITPPSNVGATYGKSYRGSVEDVAVGDSLSASPRYGGGKIRNGDGYSLSLIKNSAVPHTFEVVNYLDQDMAQRVAKALIHAIVLCHKNEKPSPF